MYLYHLTLRQASAISHAVVGQFSGKKEDNFRGIFEIALAKGKFLEIVKPDEATGKLQTLISTNVYGIIRSIAAFRLTGGKKDYLAIGSESGRIVILEYLPDKQKFDKIHQETFGRSGCRRIVPGQYLACDSAGRAVMIAAVEKQKLVYQLNRDTQANLTISSPLEAHKANTFVFHMINVDVGYENPLFACLEVDYEDADEDPTGKAFLDTKQALTYYELDLGLNHVSRKYSEPLEQYANLLIPVPGGDDGPSGLIVCSENFITYKNFGEQPDIKCPIPRRKGETDIETRGVLVVCHATYKYLDNGKRKFFFFIQTELGDVFKTEFELKDDIVTEIRMIYFDTVPVATSLCLLPHSKRRVEGGLLFVAAEAGDHHLYQINQAQDDEAQDADLPPNAIFSSKIYEKMVKERAKSESKVDIFEDNKLFQFKPRELRHLVLIDRLHSMAPILSATTFQKYDEHQLIVGCGTNKNSSLRLLRHGLEVTERAESLLPSVATGVWSVRKSCESSYDEYIVVSFTNATLVLSVGDTIDEIIDSGFLGTKRTLACCQLGDDSLVQVHPDGIRHIHADKRVSEWRTPFKRQIVKCALNQRQVAIALSNQEVLYFEMDTTGQLNEYNERKEFPAPISCMALAEIPAGELRSQFLAIGYDRNVCIMSLDLTDCMTEITRQVFASNPESLCVAELGGSAPVGSADYDLNQVSQLYMNVGLQSGELVRTRLDRISGDLSEPIRRFLGTKPVNLFNVRVHGKQSVLACTNKSWLVYTYQSRSHLSPISFEAFDYAASFNSPEVQDGIVAISGNKLRILSPERLGEMYNQLSHQLEASPRRFAMHPESGNVVVMMTDRLPLLIGPDSEADRWHSLVKLMDPRSGKVFAEFNYESNEAALSLTLATFDQKNRSWMKSDSLTTVHVGVAQDYQMRYQRASGSEIYTYSITSRGDQMSLLHKTSCQGVPRAMCFFHDRLVVGLDRVLRLYDLGQRQLLHKCASKQLPHFITTVAGAGERLFVSDAQESFTFMKYRKSANVLSVFADDTYPRFLISSCALDLNTVAGGDKFGNLVILQLNEDINDDLDDDPTGTRSLWDRGWLGGASQKADTVAIFHVGELITSLKRTELSLGRAHCLLYTTVSGSIGVFVPFSARQATSDDDEDTSAKAEFERFQTLEMHLRREAPPLCGREHLAFVSSFFPVKNVVDGDLCELFLSLDPQVQQKICDDMQQQYGEMGVQEMGLRIDQMIEKIR